VRRVHRLLRRRRRLPVTQARYVEAFYTTPVFRIERRLLAGAMSRPSTDDDARRLATGRADTFSAWRVEARLDDQLLMCDVTGRTRIDGVRVPRPARVPRGLLARAAARRARAPAQDRARIAGGRERAVNPPGPERPHAGRPVVVHHRAIDRADPGARPGTPRPQAPSE
jgi:hypothetical protein